MTKKYLDPVRHLFSRRRTLQTLATLATTSAAGCSGDDSTGATDTTDGSSTGTSSSSAGTSSTSAEESTSSTGGTATSGGTSSTSGSTTSGTSTTSDTTGDTTTGGVDACAGDGGLDPKALLAGIDHIVVLMMENRSFDHYFGARKFVEGKVVDGLNGDESNPNSKNEAVTVWEMNEFQPHDPPHEWEACHFAFNLGENNGFVLENEKSNPGFEDQVMGYHVREHIPVLYKLADEYTLCDRWHASVMGPTWPNRYYLNCATSNGGKSNFPDPFIKTIWHRLVDADIPSKIYFGDVPWVAGSFPLVPTVWGRLGDGGLSIATLTNPNTLERFFDDAAAGTLPAVAFLDPGFTSNDDHPDHDIQLGQILIASIYTAIAESPLWNKTLFIITYDEHGGFYDHVVPGKTIDDEPEFTQLGFRVPGLVIGPTVRRGCVNSNLFEHISVLKTITNRFDLQPLNDRHAQVNDLSSCIDPAYLDDPQPPAALPKIEASIAKLTARVGKTTSQPELFAAAGVTLDEAYRQKVVEDTIRLLKRAEKLGVVRLRP